VRWIGWVDFPLLELWKSPSVSSTVTVVWHQKQRFVQRIRRGETKWVKRNGNRRFKRSCIFFLFLFFINWFFRVRKRMLGLALCIVGCFLWDGIDQVCMKSIRSRNLLWWNDSRSKSPTRARDWMDRWLSLSSLECTAWWYDDVIHSIRFDAAFVWDANWANAIWPVQYDCLQRNEWMNESRVNIPQTNTGLSLFGAVNADNWNSVPVMSTNAKQKIFHDIIIPFCIPARFPCY